MAAAIGAAFTLAACDLIDKSEAPAPTPAVAPAASPLQLLLFARHEGCAPSAATTPVVQSYAAQHPSRLQLRVVYLEDSPEMFERYGVRDTPTMVFLRSDKNLEVVQTTPGAAVDHAYLETIIRKAEANAAAPSPVAALLQSAAPAATSSPPGAAAP